VFSFLASGESILLVGLLAAAAVVAWDWRVLLVALVLTQFEIAALMSGTEGVPRQMMLVQTLVIALACVMLAVSAMQVQMVRTGRQSGGWFFRLLVLALIGVAVWSLDLRLSLPEVAPAIAMLIGWLGLLAIMMLSLGDNPLFTTVALLQWCILGYALATVYAPSPTVLFAIGLAELVLALTASYLLVAERMPRARRSLADSDMSFVPLDPNGLITQNGIGGQLAATQKSVGASELQTAGGMGKGDGS
jgi:hypothetical protein